MSIKNKKVAILVEKMYQDLEVWYPYYRLIEEGVDVKFIAPDKNKKEGKYGYPLEPDMEISEVSPDDFDGVVIPGGFAPDYMRRSEKMVQFVKDMYEDKKLVAAICHGGWMLASADIINNKNVTSFYGIKDDIKNAGANFSDEEVVQDDNLITSRKPDDLPEFMKAIIKFLEK